MTSGLGNFEWIDNKLNELLKNFKEIRLVRSTDFNDHSVTKVFFYKKLSLLQAS